MTREEFLDLLARLLLDLHFTPGVAGMICDAVGLDLAVLELAASPGVASGTRSLRRPGFAEGAARLRLPVRHMRLRRGAGPESGRS